MADVNPLPCAKGCGFYGSSKTKNLCSKCYNDSLKQLIFLLEDKQEVIKTAADELSLDSLSLSLSSSVSSSLSKPESSRCESCNKKVGLLGFSCRCGRVLCSLHRYPKEHSCNFDFKTADRLILAKENPIVKTDKLGTKI